MTPLDLEPDNEILSAALRGERMPTEKVIAWLLRVLLVVLGAVGLWMYQGINARLDATVSELHTKASAADLTHIELHTDVLAVEKRVLAVEVAAPDVQRRLQRIEDKLDQLVERGR